MENKLIRLVCTEMAEVCRGLIRDTNDKKMKKELWKRVKVFRRLSKVKLSCLKDEK